VVVVDRTPDEVDAIKALAVAQIEDLEGRLRKYFAQEHKRSVGGAVGLPHRSICSIDNECKVRCSSNKKDECGLTHTQWILYKRAIQVLLACELSGQRCQVSCKWTP